MLNPVVLLIHGVSSTGEWYDTTIKECHGLFECVPIKYRYYHGWITGALKVYVWPTALLLILIAATLLLFDSTTIQLAVVLGVLVANTLLAMHAEYDWFKEAEYDWPKELVLFLVPVLYAVLGFAATLFFSGHLRIACTLAAVVATSIYLDLREYGHPFVSISQAGVASMVVLAVTSWCVYWVLDQPVRTPLKVTLAVLIGLAIVEPYIRRALAFRFVRNRIMAVRARDAFPHVVAHSLGTYLTGHILNEEERLFLGRVIFTGCVLDRSFPWHQNVGPATQQKCWAVKNYVGGGDFIPVFTGLLRSAWVILTWPSRLPGITRGTEFVANFVRWRALGWAGQQGFHDRETIVHSQRADTICGICVPGSISAAVHNVGARFAGHSTLNKDADYQCFQWLPFLWTDSADKFDYWKGICTIGNQAATALEGQAASATVTPERVENQNALAQAERKLLDGPWYWPLNNNWLSHDEPLTGR